MNEKSNKQTNKTKRKKCLRMFSDSNKWEWILKGFLNFLFYSTDVRWFARKVAFEIAKI